MAGTTGAFLLNYLCVTLAALPLLLPALHQVSISAGRQQVFSREEYSQFGYSFSQWLQGVLFPFADAPRAAWFEPQVISHVGLLTVIFLVVALIRAKNSPNLRFIVLFSLLALGAYSWAGNGIVTRLLYHLPLFGGFRWPFKLGFFVSFFMIAVATFGFDSFDTALKTAAPAPALLRRLAVPLLLALHAANFLFLHTVQPQHMFSRHHDRIPFDEPLKERLRDGRIVSIGPPIDMAGEKRIYGYSAPLLGFNYATLFGLYHFGGYEALVSAENARATMGLNERSLITVRPDLPLDMQRNLPLEYFREWGVKWYVIDSRVPLKPDDSLTLFHSDAIRNILFDRSARPLVYWVDRLDDAGITWGMTTNSMSASLESGSGGELAVNVLYNPFFTALLDGQPTEIRLANNRKMLVRIPAGSHRVSIRYRDPYFRYGVLVSLPFMLGLGLLYALHGRRSRHV
jgi:hypothetical protein